MPIKIPDTLPAFEALLHEGVRVMTETAAIRQDIRPPRIGLLNLMPNKIKTELQMARLLGASPLQVELSLVRIGNHTPRNTSENHLLAFYQTWETAKDRKFDGFIITGTPVEQPCGDADGSAVVKQNAHRPNLPTQRECPAHQGCGRRIRERPESAPA